MQATNETAVELEQSLPVALMRIGRKLKTVSARTPDEAWAVLLLHRVREHGPCRVSELAAQVGLDTSTVSRHTARMVDRGYVKRSEDPADRRAARLVITAKGRRLLDAATAARTDLIHAAVADWSHEELRTFCALIERLADAMDPHETETESR